MTFLANVKFYGSESFFKRQLQAIHLAREIPYLADLLRFPNRPNLVLPERCERVEKRILGKKKIAYVNPNLNYLQQEFVSLALEEPPSLPAPVPFPLFPL